MSSQPAPGSEPLPQSALEVGTLVADRYRILDVAGQGGMGVVYKAQHVHMLRTIALKMLLRDVNTDAHGFLRFKKEAEAAGLLTHPHIVGIHDFGVLDDQAYLAMDFLEGRSLQNVIQEEFALAPERFRHVFMQACDALDHAHQHGVVHRDIKPSNLLLVDRNNDPDYLVIVDFGLVKIMTSGDQRLTSTNMVVGSPLYMSPEQCRGLDVDHRTDIYSLGCVMYEALTGVVPFAGETVMDTLYKHISEPPVPMAVANPEAKVPEAVEEVILKAMSKNADARQQTMAELADDLERAFAGHKPKSAAVVVPLRAMQAKTQSQPPPRTAPEQGFTRGRFVMLGVSLATIAALAAALIEIPQVVHRYQVEQAQLSQEEAQLKQEKKQLQAEESAARAQAEAEARAAQQARKQAELAARAAQSRVKPAESKRPPAADSLANVALVDRQEQILEAADTAFQSNNFQSARSLYDQWLRGQQHIDPRLGPAAVPVIAKLVGCARRLNDTAAATSWLDTFDHLLSTYPRSMEGQTQLLLPVFTTAQQNGKLEVSERILYLAITQHDKEHPDDARHSWQLRLMLAQVFLQDNKLGEAKQELTQIVQSCPLPRMKQRATMMLRGMQ